MTHWQSLRGPNQFAHDAATQLSFEQRLKELTRHHHERCEPYRRILDGLWPTWADVEDLDDLPFLPVGLFKEHRLASVPDQEVYATIHSSGTTGQRPSVVVLDRETAALQSQAFMDVIGSVVGQDRLPLLIVDRPSELRGASARAVGIRGMLPLSRSYAFALDESLQPDVIAIRDFLGKHAGQSFVLFGFTFVVWSFINAVDLDLSRGTLIHSGGWKKLAMEGVSNDQFKGRCLDRCGIRRVHNYYGMAEQTGSVFVEDEHGFLVSPKCGAIRIRNPKTFAVLPAGEVGVIQVMSALPQSYPGHSLLTEDLGVLEQHSQAGPDRFRVIGRLPKAELRGCSDVAATSAG